jgi:hypothetical protein
MTKPGYSYKTFMKAFNARKKRPPSDADMLAGLPGPNSRAMLLPIMKKHVVLWSEMVSDRRQKIYSDARQEMYVRLRSAGWSYTRIAHLFNRDHTTVLSGIRSWESRNGVLEKSGNVSASVLPFVRQRDAGHNDSLAVKS